MSTNEIVKSNTDTKAESNNEVIENVCQWRTSHTLADKLSGRQPTITQPEVNAKTTDSHNKSQESGKRTWSRNHAGESKTQDEVSTQKQTTDAVHKIDDGERRVHPRKPVVCRYCKETGHKIDECTKIRCRRCGYHGHVDWTCETKICDYCHKRGHTVKECYANNQTIICKYCKGEGHMVKNCPNVVCRHCGEGHFSNKCTVTQQRK